MKILKQVDIMEGLDNSMTVTASEFERTNNLLSNGFFSSTNSGNLVRKEDADSQLEMVNGLAAEVRTSFKNLKLPVNIRVNFLLSIFEI
jgi:hypothetical protein